LLSFAIVDLLRVVCVSGDPLPELVVAALQLWVAAVDVLAGEPEQLRVVRSLEVMTAWALDCAHLSSFHIEGPA